MGDLSEAAELELLGDGTDDLHHDHDGIDEADILLEDSAIKREETELYDDAIAPSNTSFDTTKVDTQNLSTSSTPAPSVSSTTNGTHSLTGTGSSGRKYCCYIGNMTWWTTDHDLQAAFTALSIADLIDIKFFENRLNGQSKGYCLCVFGSEASVKNIMDNLPKRTVHAQSLLVLPYTKASLARFEEATARSANKDKKKEEPGVINMGTIRIGAPTGPSPGGPGLMGPSMGMGRGGPMGGPGGPGGPMGGPAPNMMGGMGGMMGRPAPGGPVPLMLNPMQQQPMMGGPVQMRGPGPVTSGPPGMMGGPGGPGSMMNGPPGMSGPGGPMGGSHGMPNMSGPPPQQMPPVMNAMQMQRPPMQMQQGPPGMGAPLQQNPMMSSAPPMRPPVQQQPGPPGMPPGAHINPQVYPGFNAPPPGGLQPPGMGMMQPGMRPMGPGHGPGNPLGSNPFNQGNMPPHQQFNGQNVMQKMNAMPPGTGGGPVSEGEFEEIMNRNRTVSSSAISRAVSDASTGDVESAVETLLTAINLIKQSRVAHDERCKVLIISLQDTLAGIESKAAGGHSSSRKHRRDRDRSRSRSRDRDRKRHRRSRSRSRSRDYDRRGRY